ncbi:MAG TPA: hypothetical protein VFX50_01060, partial [Gemmatimonadales bacterium]|nr:hypothetical protein [Gemmatimonadales bacterium]
MAEGRATAAPLLRAGIALAAGLVVLALFFQASGHDPATALGAMWRGAFGSMYAFTSGTLVRAVPLALIALGFGVAYRAGALNIGAEGQFYAGAIAATWAGLHLAAWPAPVAIPLTLAAAFSAGALWIAVPVWLRQRFGVLEVISTLLLNFVAEALVSWMVQGPLQEATHVYPQSDPLPASALLPLVPGTRLHWGFVLAPVAAAALWWVYRRTRLGFELLAAGAGPRAALVSGRIAVGRLAAGALLLSGALAGLAGGAEVMGVSRALYP